MKLTDIINTPFSQLTDERLNELADIARTEMDEWGKFANDIRTELLNRKIAKCEKHDFYPTCGQDGWCGDSGELHDVYFSESSNSWWESCRECGHMKIEEKDLGTEKYMEHCKKCDFHQKGILNCERKNTD